MARERREGAQRLRLSIPRNTRYLGAVRRAVAAVAERCGCSPSQVAQIEMAVDEACANAIRHAGPHEAGGPVEVEIGVEGGELVVVVCDSNDSIVRCAPQPASAEPCVAWWESDRRGGLGLPVMQRFMDEVHFGVNPRGGNRVEMRRQLDRAGERGR